MKTKKTLSLVLIMVTLFLLFGCTTTEHKYGDFMFQKLARGTIWLCDLSESGKQKKEVVIPAEINGKKISEVAKNLGMGRGGWTKSDYLEKIFYPQYIQTEQYAFCYCGKVNKIVLIYSSDGLTTPNCILDVNEPFLFVKSSYIVDDDSYMKCANVSYYYNYTNAPNDGYYWIDDYDYGEVITFVPSKPTRDGYKFDGWYKEPQCLNTWNFDSDTLPQEKVENDKTVYKETKLYAKWDKE